MARKCEVCDVSLADAESAPARPGGLPRFTCANGHSTIGYSGRAYGKGDLADAVADELARRAEQPEQGDPFDGLA